MSDAIDGGACGCNITVEAELLWCVVEFGECLHEEGDATRSCPVLSSCSFAKSETGMIYEKIRSSCVFFWDVVSLFGMCWAVHVQCVFSGDFSRFVFALDTELWFWLLPRFKSSLDSLHAAFRMVGTIGKFTDMLLCLSAEADDFLFWLRLMRTVTWEIYWRLRAWLIMYFSYAWSISAICIVLLFEDYHSFVVSACSRLWCPFVLFSEEKWFHHSFVGHIGKFHVTLVCVSYISAIYSMLQAYLCYVEALRIQPSFAIAWSNLAGLLMEAGELQRALNYYKVWARHHLLTSHLTFLELCCVEVID